MPRRQPLPADADADARRPGSRADEAADAAGTTAAGKRTAREEVDTPNPTRKRGYSVRRMPNHEIRRSPLLAALALAATAHAEPKITAINVYPPDINLNTKADLQRFVVVATRDDGVTLDVTAQAAVKLVDANLCRLDKNALYPAGRRRRPRSKSSTRGSSRPPPSP